MLLLGILHLYTVDNLSAIYAQANSIAIEHFDSLFTKNNVRLDTQNNNLYLVFAGPYPASPTSSFGHIFVLAKPKTDKPILLWDAFDFAAIQGSSGGIGFFFKGLFGGISGRFRKQPFYEKIREYTFLESRNLYLFPLRFDQLESLSFQDFLLDLEKKDFDYLIMNDNCAGRIDSVLREAGNRPKSENSALVFPKSVIEYWTDPNDNYLVVMNKNPNQEDVQILSEINKGELSKEKLREDEKAILLKTNEWYFNRRHEHLSPEEKMFMDNLRIEIAQSQNSRPSPTLEKESGFYLHPNMLLGCGIKNAIRNTNTFSVFFRSGIHEFFEDSKIYPSRDFLGIFKLEVGLSANRMHLIDLTIFDQTSLTPYSSLTGRASWKFKAGISRRYELTHSPPGGGITVGFGLTTSVFTSEMTITAMIRNELVYIDNNNILDYLGPEIICINNFGEYFTFSGNYGFFRKVDNNFNYFEMTNSLSANLLKNYHIIFEQKTYGKENILGLRIQTYIF